MKKHGAKDYMAPWEAAFDRVLTPLEELNQRSTAHVVRGDCPFCDQQYVGHTFHHLLDMPFTIGWQELSLSMSVHHWTNDSFMAIFFSSSDWS